MLSKLKRLALRSLNYSLTLKSAAGPIKIPVINDVGRAHLDSHEPHMQALLERLYKPGTLLVDVGVNIGQTLVKYVSVAGKTCRYVGFEPNPRAASYVDEIILRNGLMNAAVVPVGLGATTRIATLLLGTEGTTDPGASIDADMRDAAFYGARKAVPVFNGDDAFEELQLGDGPMILKVDVEGAELEVLTGLSCTLERVRPPVILEILPAEGFSTKVNTYRNDQANRLKQFMNAARYKAFAVNADGSLCEGISLTSDYLFIPQP